MCLRFLDLLKSSVYIMFCFFNAFGLQGCALDIRHGSEDIMHMLQQILQAVASPGGDAHSISGGDAVPESHDLFSRLRVQGISRDYKRYNENEENLSW